MLSRLLLSFTLALLLLPPIGRCDCLPANSRDASIALLVAKEEPAQQTFAPPQTEDASAPTPSELTPDLVYAVLVGQVARQRGEYRLAFTHFLHAAQLAQDPSLAELAARAALALEDTEAVQRAADAWLHLAPNAIGAHQLAAYARLEADDIRAATEHLRRLIRLAAEEGENGYGQAARLVSKLKLANRRLQLMETLTAEDPESADAWFARAVVAAGADRHDEAVQAARRASQLRPEWNEPRIFLVQMLLSHGDRDEARKTLETFVSESPDDQGLRLLYAQLLVDEEEFSRARNVFEHMLRNRPKEPDVLFALGVLSLQLEDLDSARDYFVQLRDTGARQDDSAYYLGQVEELAESWDSALSWYRKADGERTLDARIRMAQIQARQGKVERAQEILHQLREQWPTDAPTLYLIEAEILSERDQEEQAMEVYDEAVNAFPGNHDLLYARGLHAVALDRLDVMERDFKAIIADDPEHADALNALGYSLADRTDRYEEALGYIERALAIKPDDAAVLDSMGWVQFRLGKPEQALPYLERALALMPDSEIAAHLGEVLWTLGRRDQAWSTWEEALARDPEHEYLLQVIGRYRVTRTEPAHSDAGP